jgi:hypothetical protein
MLPTARVNVIPSTKFPAPTADGSAPSLRRLGSFRRDPTGPVVRTVVPAPLQVKGP